MSLKDKLAGLSRAQTIISVFAKHGFSQILQELGLVTAKSASSIEDESTIPSRLRMACEELGPTFIKLGQLLSTRPDIFPEAYIEEFSKLTDQVPAFAFEDVQRIIEKDLGQSADFIFSEIEQKPMAAASISQVHRATIKETGQRIVIKIQRPRIAKTIQLDIQILRRVAGALEGLREDFRLMNPAGIIEEFQRSIHEELDFTLEAKNMEAFQKNLGQTEGLIFPQPLWELTTQKILAMPEMTGTPLAHIKNIPAEVDRRFLVESIVNFFFESIFFHGLFHADAHAGNILLQTEGRGRLVLLDFGMVGRLSDDLRQNLSKIFLALISQDFAMLAQTYVEIGEFGRRVNLRDFQKDVSEFLSPRLGKPLREIHLGEMMLESTRIARKYQVRVPRDLILFYRSIITLESIGRKLDPDFEFVSYSRSFAQTLIRRRFTSEEIIRDLLKAFEGLRSIGTDLPSQMRHIVDKIDHEAFLPQAALKRWRHLSFMFLLDFSFFAAAVYASLVMPQSGLKEWLWGATATGLIISAVLLLRGPRTL
jgi:ubiquinone biosynthesis protein